MGDPKSKVDNEFKFGREEEKERKKNPPMKLPGRPVGQKPPKGGIDPEPKDVPAVPPTEPGRKGDPT